MDRPFHRLYRARQPVSLTILPDAIHIMHKSVNPDEQEMPTEDERFEAALAEEEAEA